MVQVSREHPQQKIEFAAKENRKIQISKVRKRKVATKWCGALGTCLLDSKDVPLSGAKRVVREMEGKKNKRYGRKIICIKDMIGDVRRLETTGNRDVFLLLVEVVSI